MAKTYYQALGIKEFATADEIRSAYRKLVLVHHPDHSKDPNSKERFLEIAEAWEVLGEPARRRAYDQQLLASRRTPEPKVQEPVYAPPPPSSNPRTVTTASIGADVTRLSMMFTRGQYADAERLARGIVSRDPKQPLPYAVLGDLAKTRGNVKEAQKMYAFAVQMDPDNPLYQRRYEEIVGCAVVAASGIRPPKPSTGALWATSGVVALCGFYLCLSRESPLLPAVPSVSSLTLGVAVMSFVAGVGLGTGLSLGNWLERYGLVAKNAVGKISPTVALAGVAIVNFWAAAVLYSGLALTQQSFSRSTSRLVGATAIATLFFALCATISPSVNALQALLWSGNPIYLGSIAGWMVSDAFRRT